MARANSQNASKTGKKSDNIRTEIIDALMRLAADRKWDEINLSDIALEAGLSLADIRHHFPSKGAMLAGLARKIDLIVLEQDFTDMAAEPPKERLLDVLMRLLDAAKPYKVGIRNIMQSAGFDPLASLALNQVLTNSMRFMLEAAGLVKKDGINGLKTQGLVLGWLRVLAIWIKDEDPDMTKTMAALDRELTRGEQAVQRLDEAAKFMHPIKTLMQSICNTGNETRFKTRERATNDEAFDAGI